jgi:long-chain fatty acid transport protein
MRGRKRAGALAVILAAMPGAALATDGYFQAAYGVKELGRGGTSIAIPDDAFGGANNPATMGFVGDVLDIDAYLFAPSRNASRSGNAFGLNGSANSGDDAFFFPAFGYVHTLTDTISLGISVYANGGMDTDYPGGQIAPFHCGPGAPAANLLCGEGRLGVNLEQFFFAPTLTYKVTPNNAFGISPVVAYQRFSAEGLQAFSGLSSAPGNVTNRGFSNSAGVGVRIGWMGKITETLSLGATYASRISMSRFQAYEGLFAEHGEFDILKASVPASPGGLCPSCFWLSTIAGSITQASPPWAIQVPTWRRLVPTTVPVSAGVMCPSSNSVPSTGLPRSGLCARVTTITTIPFKRGM